MRVSIEGLDEADVLAVLYNASYPHGNHFLDYDPAPMTREKAREVLATTRMPESIAGRSIYIRFDGGSDIETHAYDADKRPNYAFMAIADLRMFGTVNSTYIQTLHLEAVEREAKRLRFDPETPLGRKLKHALETTLGGSTF